MIQIKFNKDYRCFKAGQMVNIDLKPLSITYLVGPNGCGKSTITRMIRAVKDSLHEQNKKDHGGLTSSQLNFIKHDMVENAIEISGLDDYTHIFALDSDIDNPLNFENCATASALISGGGLAAQRSSRGQGCTMQFVKFCKKFTEIKDQCLENEQPFRPLVLIDEIDEGMDLRLQLFWNQLLENKFFPADIICISHSPICMLSRSILPVNAYDVQHDKHTTLEAYIKDLSGAGININYDEYIPIHEQLKSK